MLQVLRRAVSMGGYPRAPKTGPKPMHKDLSSVLTSRITYHIWILKGYSKEPSQ